MNDSERLLPVALVVASQWAWRLLIIVAAIAAVVYATATLSFIVGPIVFAMVASALLEPIRRLLLSVGASGTIAWMVAFSSGVILVTSVSLLAIDEFTSNYDELASQATEGLGKLTDWLETGPIGMDTGGLDEAIDRAFASVKEDPGEAITGTVSVLSTTGSVLAGGLLALITTLFFMKDRSLMWRWFVSLFPARVQPVTNSAGHAAWEVLINYTKVTLTSAVVDSTVIGLAAVIAGLPVAFALSVVVFLFAFIPTVGAILSGSLVVLVGLVAKGPTVALVLAIVVLVVQQLDANVMYPMLASRHLSLHPLASLLLVAAGGVLAGLFGAFVAVPLCAMLIAAGRELRPAVVAASAPPGSTLELPDD